MATIKSELERLKFLVSKGRGEEKCHVVLIEEEARKRIANKGPKLRTRFVMELDCAEAYSQFAAEKDRWLHVVGNKSVAITMMLMAWQKYSDEDLREAAEGMAEIDESRMPDIVPKAHIPPWPGDKP